MKPNRVQLIISIVLLVVILAACGKSPASTPSGSGTAAPASKASSGDCANAYYPVAAGDSWSYSSSGGNLGDYTYTQKITAANGTGFTKSYAASTGVDLSIDWKCSGGNLAALDAGAAGLSMSTSKITMTSNSIQADGYNIPASFNSGATWSEKVSATGTVVEGSTSKTVTSQIAYQLDCSAGGTDAVTVPAGKFDAVKAVCTKETTVSAVVQGKTIQLGDNKENITYWYAKGVGFVKSVASGGSNNETVVLTQYTAN
jgi:hypothetical protein